MNKQEALVAILEECRSHEQPHEETRRVLPGEVHDLVLDVARNLDLLMATGLDGGTSPDVAYDRVRDALVRLAGGALYLLVDEVDVVDSGPDLEKWLAEGGAGRHGPTVINGAINSPTPMIVEQTRYVPVIVPEPHRVAINDEELRYLRERQRRAGSA